MLSISVSAAQVAQLQRWVKASNTAQGVALRSRIILMAYQGESSQAIGEKLKVSQPTIRRVKFPRIRGQGGRSTFRKDCQHATNTSHL